MKPYRGIVVGAVFLTLLVTAFQIVPPRLFQYAIDSGISPALAAQKSAELASTPAAKEAAQAVWENWRDERGPGIILLIAGILVAVVAFR
ncbi:MAG: hypothetical protein MUC92_13645, partial [Fimbriimonadaceae bacterium]|nr:hypothetical protein [Fimbriimonadaceae bacterium]